MFGYYSSKRMKVCYTYHICHSNISHSQDWAAIVSAYERDNVYLAEAATQLQRASQYDLPSLKKQITKALQSIEV
jgi:hypothetical protein